jgi:hypothetical protein
MSDEKYTDLHVLSVDGTGEVLYGMYKAMRVERFKRTIAIQSRGGIKSWQDIVLYCMEVLMEDGTRALSNCEQAFNIACPLDQTLESYGLRNVSIFSRTSKGSMANTRLLPGLDHPLRLVYRGTEK